MTTSRANSEQRRIVLERARGCCEYCRSQARFSNQDMSIEHIVPRSKGGLTLLDNLALACQGCNNRKYNKFSGVDPITHDEVRLYHPRLDRWQDHFAWNDDCAMMIGLTPIGRATIVALQLNWDELVNLRRVLFAAGEHPPALSEAEPKM